jgi:K+ potassium transporter
VAQEANTVSVSQRSTARAALAVGALGVVFGDIGTSPLYTVQTVFDPSDPHPVKVSHDSIFGVVSLIFWSVTIIVTVTYVLLVMRADNRHLGAVRGRGRPGRGTVSVQPGHPHHGGDHRRPDFWSSGWARAPLGECSGRS